MGIGRSNEKDSSPPQGPTEIWREQSDDWTQLIAIKRQMLKKAKSAKERSKLKKEIEHCIQQRARFSRFEY